MAWHRPVSSLSGARRPYPRLDHHHRRGPAGHHHPQLVPTGHRRPGRCALPALGGRHRPTHRPTTRAGAPAGSASAAGTSQHRRRRPSSRLAHRHRSPHPRLRRVRGLCSHRWCCWPSPPCCPPPPASPATPTATSLSTPATTHETALAPSPSLGSTDSRRRRRASPSLIGDVLAGLSYVRTHPVLGPLLLLVTVAGRALPEHWDRDCRCWPTPAAGPRPPWACCSPAPAPAPQPPP